MDLEFLDGGGAFELYCNQPAGGDLVVLLSILVLVSETSEAGLHHRMKSAESHFSIVAALNFNLQGWK